jgi:hypothetical protein
MADQVVSDCGEGKPLGIGPLKTWCWHFLEQTLQPFLALDQRQLSSALVVQEQKIEGEGTGRARSVDPTDCMSPRRAPAALVEKHPTGRVSVDIVRAREVHHATLAQRVSSGAH